MPEAVIVAAARSPIGRAGKGSLVDVRPDDLAAAIVRAALDQGARARPGRHRRPLPRLRAARRRAGLQHGPGGRDPARPRPPAGRHHHPLLLVQPADHPDGVPRDQGRRGRRVRLGGGRVRLALRQGQLRRAPGHDEPRLRRAPASVRGSAPGRRRTWSDPREDGEVPDIYIAMGQTAENLAQLRGLSRQELDEFGVRSQNLAEKAIADGFWEREITPVTTPSGDLVTRDDGPRAGVTLRGRVRAEAGVPPGRPRDRGQLLRAQRRGGGGRRHVRQQGRASSGSRRWPGSCPPG